MKFKYNDGGRKAAGYKGTTSDCVVRAIAIAGDYDYQQIYDLVNQYGKCEKVKKESHRSTARTGVAKKTTRNILEALGWKWTPTMFIGQGCKVHLKAEELPPGRLVVSVSRHLTAVIDGVLHDNYDCTRDGTRCVYGYWTKEE